MGVVLDSHFSLPASNLSSFTLFILKMVLGKDFGSVCICVYFISILNAGRGSCWNDLTSDLVNLRTKFFTLKKRVKVFF